MSHDTPTCFTDFFKPPSWSTGHVSLDDAMFLDALVRELKPREAIEIGVASGCSSAVLLRALASVGQDRRLYSFDLAHNCYFAPDRPVGSAVAEMAPEHTEFWHLFTGEIATDAGRKLAGRGVELVFIDGDHRHPWPTIDLLALLPALSPQAWIILHDTRLSEISPWRVFGPKYLMESWPGQRREEPRVGNVGAVQLWGETSNARSHLLNLLRRDWQTPIDKSLLDSLGVDQNLRPNVSKFSHVARRLSDRLSAVQCEKRPIVVWGAGDGGRRCLVALQQGAFRTDALVDRDPTKHGLEIDGIVVESPDRLRDYAPRPFIVIASMFAAEIERQLSSWGFGAQLDFGVFETAEVPVEASFFEVDEMTSEKPIFGMTTLEEQRYLRSFASKSYSGVGAIVDLGCWMGSTTIPLAHGLDENPDADNRVVYAYDTFVWHTWMDRYAGELSGKVCPGESFLPLFRERVFAVSSRINVRPEDLTKTEWHDGPIEFLLIDAAKDWRLCSAINRHFLPMVIPGQGLVMHQDFKFWGCPWIHLAMYRLRDCFVIDRDLENSPGTIFRLLSTPSPDRLSVELKATDFSIEEIEGAYAHWLACIHGPQTYLLSLARILALLEAEKFDHARQRILEAGASSIFMPDTFIDAVRRHIPDFVAPVNRSTWIGDLTAAVEKGREVWIWGAGSAGLTLLKQHASLRKHAVGLIDSDPKKSGATLSGLPVKTPDWLSRSKRHPFIVVATTYSTEVISELSRLTFEKGSDFAVAEVG